MPTLPHTHVTSAHLKRKHDEIVDRVSDEDERGQGMARVAKPPAHDEDMDEQRIEDDADSGSDASAFECILDDVELNPFVAPPDDPSALRPEYAAQIREALRRIGPAEFMRTYVTNPKIPIKLLGTAFGIDPGLNFDSESYLRVLSMAIIRAYQKRQKLPQYNTIDDAAELLRQSKNIMVITGAGISTSLGIPDFRSKGTGFYDKLRDMGYEGGEDVFDIYNFDENPSIFYSLAGEILPDQQRYTPTHAFIKLLQDKGKLQTNYTQNIDNLEELAGVDRSKLIQCHGSFATASCRKCKFQVPGHEIFDQIRAKQVARCKKCKQDMARLPPPPKKKKQSTSKPRKNDFEDSSDDEGAYNIPEAGVMKPDITFFGEQLPDNFFDRFTEKDSKTVDLCIVIGTSLKVAPVSEMANYLPKDIPHIFVSREPIEHVNFDIQLLGDCDTVVYELSRRAGWRLQHEMIPPDLRVKVKPVEDSTYRWIVKPRKPKVSTASQQSAGSVGNGSLNGAPTLTAPTDKVPTNRTPSPLRRSLPHGPSTQLGVPARGSVSRTPSPSHLTPSKSVQREATTSPTASRNGASPQPSRGATPQMRARSVESTGSGSTFFSMLHESISKPPTSS
ncbi:SIR2-domain-containing protein [Hortaea werneckii]|nr:SIR2-domain-containing protein [Hortaea werneckii]KAI6858700.1 SIR2-domain-containing protein [Hortaea werneckii]KAI7346613.1 SIR2-domain-containing protein [Hortaea werneckii]KAI7560172.1 SIR2-domain-containing protein [Hortaea werneckii]KAI7601469.1 SIR2-domain-containing protein [Hortaea werneckii]